MRPPQSILVIDDDLDIGEFIAAAADLKGVPCTVTKDSTSFLKALSAGPSMILMDLLMPGLDGIELLRCLGEMKCQAGIVLMSGIDKRVIETAEQLAVTLDLMVVGRLKKPFGLDDLEPFLGWLGEAQVLPLTNRTQYVAFDDHDLHTAVEEDEFVIHFQPQINIASRNVTGIEALVRWQHPKLGMTFPDQFIGRAERLSLIEQLGWIVMRRSLATMTRFTDTHGNLLNISINVSPSCLRNLRFPDILLSLIEDLGVSARNVVLEITETGVLNNLSNTLDVLTRLRLKQIQLSIDDFGTGYSMLQQVKQIPATELKIDRSFIQNLFTNSNDRIMVQKTIEMGHELGMTVVAEGVETQRQLDWLTEHHCDVAQGYLFSPALPADDLVEWLAKYSFSMSPQNVGC